MPKTTKFTLLRSLQLIKPGSIKHLAEAVTNLVEKKLWARVLAGMLAGLLVGFLISPSGIFGEALRPYSTDIEVATNWLALPAKFFLHVIQMVVIPLILASIVRGIASTDDAAQMKSLGIRFSLYVLGSSVAAAAVGVVLSRLIRPGAGLQLSAKVEASTLEPTGLSLKSISPDTLVNFLPSNPLSSIVEGQMMEVVVVAIIGGVALVSIDVKQSKIILDVLEVVQSICMTIISWAMNLAPYAVFGLITQVTATTGFKALQSMGLYVVTAFAGFAVVVLAYILLASTTRKHSPLQYLKIIATPMLLAFSTSSSAATMPVTMKVAEEELNIDPSTARFLIPLGTTVNMAGSAIWHTTAVIFLSQAYQIDLGIGQIAFVVATSIGSAIGSPGVPGVGIGILAAVLLKLGIPIEGVSLIMGVDRLVDMGCTVVNVSGDLTAATLFGGKATKVTDEVSDETTDETTDGVL